MDQLYLSATDVYDFLENMDIELDDNQDNNICEEHIWKSIDIACQTSICTTCAFVDCKHQQTEENNGQISCLGCNTMLNTVFVDENWRCGTSRRDVPKGRGNRRGTNKSIRRECLENGFDMDINLIALAEMKYNYIMSCFNDGDGNTKMPRGKPRRSIIVNCITYTLWEKGDKHHLLEDIGRKFQLENPKDLSSGTDIYLRHFSGARKIVQEPADLVPTILRKANLDEEETMSERVRIIKLICLNVKNKAHRLNASNPRSVSAAAVFFWLHINKEIMICHQLTEKIFAARVGLSLITIKSLANIIAEKFGCDISAKHNKH